MAIDYDGANSGVFTRIGKLIKYINSRLTPASTTLPAELKAIADLYEASDTTHIIDGLYDAYNSMQQNLVSERITLAGYVDLTLLDRDTVLDELGVAASSAEEVLVPLHRQMVVDAEYIKLSTVTIGTVTAAAGNIGNGTVLLSKVLDGYNSPIQGAQACIYYAGLNSQLAVSETMVFEVTSDSSRDGLEAGAESVRWDGGLAAGTLGYQSDGSGPGPTLTVAGGSTILQNGTFDSFSSNVPTGWTIETGTAGTHVLQETLAINVYRGSSLELAGDGVINIKVSQAIPAGRMQPRRLYCVSMRIMAQDTAPGGGLTATFEGTGYSNGGTELVQIVDGDFTTSFTLYHFWIVTPPTIPSDWKLSIYTTGAPDAGTPIFVDDVFITEAVYHGGIAAVVVPGDDAFAVGDRFTVAITNDGAGAFQEFFRKWFRFQLPSSSGGGITIADSLAT